ncbi:protein SLOW GREEN 1, chloroplastic-like [Gastrolobium bilobum]|uniref:protein SLOW GREEN 1, chloroplastic-like n=1 Tax=Gastrolobium bilobum TaxID=150636 RepID=UPI002AB1A817|nr:protein SLOW GREEN 1, chloroplastic-like [Gastrolobium bilobum]XP_061351322.1 protein SLOW GREEN 1, chloroplastic-like [Gastrolobium bilobum]XP_061351323.1 protein SLOW GREEN 1, chloroplastic-like [Gastrolobium bilobum]XP_061351324.1 protein SLOW GREEN 1, chloroplastic-like [Gastrolobium bilobum]
MESLPKFRHSHLSLIHRHSSLPTPTPFSSLSFRSLQPPHPFSSSPFQLSSIRASSSPLPSPLPRHHAFHKPQNPLTNFLQTLSPFFSPLAEPTCIAIAAAAFFFMRLQLKPAAAALMPPAAESVATENLSIEENERAIEEQLRNNPDDAEALRSLVEVKVRARKIEEAIQVMDRLIELEPEELEWPLLKAHLYSHNGEYELARKGFEDLLKEDSFRVEAFHGLLLVTSELNESTKDLSKRVEEAVKHCQEKNMDSEVRDLKLLIAQIKVIEGDYSDAMKMYQELVKEEPSDFRPYLCQGVVYTMMRKKDEAEKQFEKYRSLLPEDHPYKEYFENNSKTFSQNIRK